MGRVLPQGDQHPREQCEDPEGELKIAGTESSTKPFLDGHATSVASGSAPGVAQSGKTDH